MTEEERLRKLKAIRWDANSPDSAIAVAGAPEADPAIAGDPRLAQLQQLRGYEAPAPNPVLQPESDRMAQLQQAMTAYDHPAPQPWLQRVVQGAAEGIAYGDRLPDVRLQQAQLARQQQGDRLAEMQQIQSGINQRQTAQDNDAYRQAQLSETARLRKTQEDAETRKNRMATSANLATLRKSGLRPKVDPVTGEPTGETEPIPLEEMSPSERVDAETKQAGLDLKKALADAANARAELLRLQADPNSPQFKLVQQQRDVALQNAKTAAKRLGLSEDQFEMRAFGTNNGQALPGSMINDNGEPVGTALQQNVRPTGTERNKADLASSAHEQIGSMKDIVQRRQDIFGPAAGRTTDFTVWLGSQDPDAQRFRAARTIAGDHLAGVFGGRSEAALNALDAAIGQFKDNPAAVLAGLDQLDQANDRFVKAGTVKTTGSNAAGTAGKKTMKFEDLPK